MRRNLLQFCMNITVIWDMMLCVCVCVCMRERERQRDFRLLLQCS